MLPINKTLQEIRETMFSYINDAQALGLPQKINLNRGVFRGLIELWCRGLHQLYLVTDEIFKNAFPLTASGEILELHCKQVNVYRRNASSAIGYVSFTRNISGNIIIPKNKIVATKPNENGEIFQFKTVEDAVLIEEDETINVRVEAINPGAKYNVGPNEIIEIITPISGIKSITNGINWLENEGTDLEDDESLRKRYELAWKDVGGVTKYAYESWALSVPGVLSCRVVDDHPRGQGTIDIVIIGENGLPTQNLIDEVQAVFDTNKPVNDDPLAISPSVVFVEIEIELVLYNDYGMEEEIINEAKQRIRSLFDSIIAYDFTTHKIIAELMQIEGVKKINIIKPVSDIEIQKSEIAQILNEPIISVSYE